MNFLNLEVSTKCLKINQHNQITIIAPQEYHIPSNEFVQINLKLVLVALPKNHIIKITNTQKNYKIISEFWLPSCSILNLIIVSMNPLTIKMGETLCYLHLLPIKVFFPGTSPSSFIVMKKIIFFLFFYFIITFFIIFLQNYI